LQVQAVDVDVDVDGGENPPHPSKVWNSSHLTEFPETPNVERMERIEAWEAFHSYRTAGHSDDGS